MAPFQTCPIWPLVQSCNLSMFRAIFWNLLPKIQLLSGSISRSLISPSTSLQVLTFCHGFYFQVVTLCSDFPWRETNSPVKYTSPGAKICSIWTFPLTISLLLFLQSVNAWLSSTSTSPAIIIWATLETACPSFLPAACSNGSCALHMDTKGMCVLQHSGHVSFKSIELTFVSIEGVN